MNPQLVIQDLGGVHNSDLEKTSARLMQGASWKRQRVVVVIPSADTIPAKVALSHWNLGFPPNNGVIRILAVGQEVGQAYSNAVQFVLDHPELKTWEYLLTVEHDNAPPPDGVIRLIEQMEKHPELACVSGLYFTKGPGGVAQVWGDVKDPVLNFRPVPPDPNGGLVECCGTGMGFALWRLSMFHDPKLRRPWFQTPPNMTQDLFFWSDARAKGYRCAVDCSIRVGHYDLAGQFGIPDMMW